MKIFLDTSKVSEIEKWLPVIDGVTTNPSILLKDGGKIEDVFSLVGEMPVSVEATGDFETEANMYSSKYENAVIKIPLLRPNGKDNLELIKRLTSNGIKVNCTALFSLPQIILATKVGSRYVSLFAGRIDDEGNDSYYSVAKAQRFLNDYGYEEDTTELIIGSIRSIGQVVDCAASRVDIVTIPPAILEKMVMHRFSLDTVKQFERDAEEIKRLDLVAKSNNK